MVLITNSEPIHNIVGVCKDGTVALNFLRTIAKHPLQATNGKWGTAQEHRFDDGPYDRDFSDCEKSPCDWQYIVDGVKYYLTPIDYIQ